jgi:hypothetical protein
MIESREEFPENEIQNDFLSYNSRKLRNEFIVLLGLDCP